MEGYINAAEQVKEDILDQYLKYHKSKDADAVFSQGKRGKELFDNIEIVFRRSAKAKMFSGKINKKLVDIEELVPVYFTTSDDESYKDCMNAITLGKRISYFLFTNRAESFDLSARTDVNEKLRKLQEKAPEIAVQIYNHSKDLFMLIDANVVDYEKVQPRVEKYLESLGSMLNAQKDIYVIEVKLATLFKKYVEKTVLEEWFSGAGKVNRAGLNALIQVIRAMDKRGMNVPNVKDRVNPKVIGEMIEELEDHVTTIQSEIEVVEDMVVFIGDIIHYMERSGMEVKSQEVTAGATPKDQSLSKKFLAWLKH